MKPLPYPQRLKSVLPPHVLAELSQTFLAQNPVIAYLPRNRWLPDFLDFILGTLKIKNWVIPHLEDLIAYEKAAIRLTLYTPPGQFQESLEPLLSQHVALLESGPHLPQLLERLLTHSPLDTYSEIPRQHYLLLRTMTGYELNRLPPVIYQAFRLCQGNLAWDQICELVLAEQAEDSRENQTQLLNEWYAFALQERILIQAHLLN